MPGRCHPSDQLGDRIAALALRRSARERLSHCGPGEYEGPPKAADEGRQPSASSFYQWVARVSIPAPWYPTIGTSHSSHKCVAAAMVRRSGEFIEMRRG
jgi:hypothetical protein